MRPAQFDTNAQLIRKSVSARDRKQEPARFPLNKHDHDGLSNPIAVPFYVC